MATRRMISTSISYSAQVNHMSEFAQLLFTWCIPHTDDFGKLEGDPEVLKARIMPMSKRTPEDVENAILEMIDANLINRYEADNKKIIEFIGFDRHQTGLNKRTKSKFPENPGNSQEFLERLESVGLIEQKRNKQNLINANRTEEHNTWNNPKDFIPTNAGETAALETWKKLEPNNPLAFHTIYHHAYRKGLPENLFYQFTSEINQDSSIRNKGQVFHSKVKEYLERIK